MDIHSVSNGLLTNGSSEAQEEEEEHEEVHQTDDSSLPSICELSNMPNTIFHDEFTSEFNLNVVNASFSQMKDSIGFDVNRQYTGKEVESIFEVLKLMISNYNSRLMKKYIASNLARIKSSVLKTQAQISVQNGLQSSLSTRISVNVEPSDNDTDKVNGDSLESSVRLQSLESFGQHLLNNKEIRDDAFQVLDGEIITDEVKSNDGSSLKQNDLLNNLEMNDEMSQNSNANSHMDIDVEAFMTDEEDDADQSDKSDSQGEKGHPSASNVKCSNAEEQGSSKPNVNEFSQTNAESDNLRIRIPDVLKDLEQYVSTEDEDHLDDADHNVSPQNDDSQSNFVSDKVKKKSAEMNDLFSQDISSIPNIDIGEGAKLDSDLFVNDVKEHSSEDDFFLDPFSNNLGLDDLNQICGTTITGQIEDGGNDSEEEKEKKTEKKEKVIETEKSSKNNENDEELSDTGNDPAERDKINQSDNENVNDDFAAINKLLTETNKLVNSDDNGDDDVNAVNSENDSRSNFDEEKEDINISRKLSLKRLFSDDESNKGNEKSAHYSDSSTAQKPKKKRKRVILDISSGEEGDQDESDSVTDSDSPNKSRKKIKKILSPTKLNKETLNAEKAELERRKRIEVKQKLYNQETETKSSIVEEVILDFDNETKKAIIEVDQAFVEHLKPHQANGIKFMFDSTIETVKRLNEEGHAGGCILAHSMGLGKTFQVIAFLHTIMTNQHIKEKINKVLIIVPYNVIKNWANEFEKWFDDCGIEKEIGIFEITTAKLNNRISLAKMWFEKGGIMLITINLFSNLFNVKNKKNPKGFPTFKKCLLDPGPDMVIIDEGHLLKNDQGAFNQSVSQIKTLRRVILTGTPLQNNLSEYFTMVDFVKPRLLGTKKEFENRFENPIRNGQHTDSTPYDVKVMKKRVHILHKLLKGCIHRCDDNILVPYLQPKFEYVLSLRLTPTQIDLYKHYLDNLVDRSRGVSSNLFHDSSILRLIWNHPALLKEHYLSKKETENEEDTMDDFIDDNTSKESDLSENRPKKRIKTRSGIVLEDKCDSDSDLECIFERKVNIPTVKEKSISEKDLETNRLLRDGKVIEEKRFATSGWFEKYLPEDIYQIELSTKFTLLFSILEKCEIIGDKILIFSQSLFNLNLIERFLKDKMDEYNEKYGCHKSYDDLVEATGGVSHRWIQGMDYFRIDGKVNSQNRTSIVEKFNDPKNHRARLMLVSTKAGGIGTNLIGANRCIIFDASWNPSNDMQAIFRIFRYGQTKPVYVYRFTAFGTMESKIYERQIIKQSLSHRVLDEQQIQRHFKASEINELYTFNSGTEEKPKFPALPKDILLADIFIQHKDSIISYHEHDSLLEARPEEELTEDERKAAWTEYEMEKEPGILPPPIPNLQVDNNMQLTSNLQDSSQFGQYLADRNFNTAFAQKAATTMAEASNSRTSDLSPNILNHQMRPYLASSQTSGLTSSLAQMPCQNDFPKQSNLNQQNSNSRRLTSTEEQAKYEQDIDALAIEKNIFQFMEMKVDINLNTIVGFDDKNLEYFEKKFFNLLEESNLTHLTKDEKQMTQYMFKYIDKCLSTSAVYLTAVKQLAKPGITPNPVYSRLAKGKKSLENIHQEFVKKYKSNFNSASFPVVSHLPRIKSETKPGPSILREPKVTSSLNTRQMRCHEVADTVEPKNIEFINLSDDEM